MRPSRVSVPGGCTTLKQSSFNTHHRLATAVASLATDNGPVADYGQRVYTVQGTFGSTNAPSECYQRSSEPNVSEPTEQVRHHSVRRSYSTHHRVLKRIT